VPIEEVNDAFGLNLLDPNYDTIAGYVLGRLGRIGMMGDVVEAISNKRRLRFQIKVMDGLRIARLKLEISTDAPPSVQDARERSQA